MPPNDDIGTDAYAERTIAANALVNIDYETSRCIDMSKNIKSWMKIRIHCEQWAGKWLFALLQKLTKLIQFWDFLICYSIQVES